jgi:phosphatidylserine/phosphatidylglycerophosphate/cardiolipin synthase-like enzyme
MKLYTKLVSGIFVMLCLWHSCEAKRARKDTAINQEVEFQYDAASALGKTHFVVGLSEQQLKNYQKQKKEISCAPESDAQDLLCDGCVKRVLFSPDDDIQKILLRLIDAEKESLRLTAYSFTDGDVAQALIRAHQRGVKIEIVADPSCLQDRFGKVPMLKEHDVVVFVYNPDHNAKDKKSLASSIMHNKFIIFGRNVLGKSIVWTGSFNWTKSAHKRNQENVLILDDAVLIAHYAKQFELLKKRCHGVKPKKEHRITQLQKDCVPYVLSKKGTLFEHGEIRI